MRQPRTNVTRLLRTALFIAATSGAIACSPSGPAPTSDDAIFAALLETVAEGWRANDAALAASAFAEDAIYVEPPDRQLYVGRDAIYEFFGGEAGRESWMAIDFHSWSYNVSTAVGAAEFTFSWEGGQVHGMVSIRVRDDKIWRWREYFYDSELEWDEFQRTSSFDDVP